MDVVHAVLTRAHEVPALESRDAWWAQHRAVTRELARPIEAAAIAGFHADRLGYAFASGYQAALRALVPDLPADRPASICVTERGGAHPRAIETKLTADGAGRYRLDGHKRWATLGAEEGVLLVAAVAGTDERGRSQLRLARIDGARAGVRLRPMPEPSFTPEIGHEEIDLEGVLVEERELYPGDGWSRYAKPFRTIEDLHVHAAILAYAIREVRAHGLPRSIAERLVALLTTLIALAEQAPDAPEVHVALAGTLALSREPLDDLGRAWSRSESPAHARWERDRALFSVAARARDARLGRAWEALASG